MPWLFHAEGLDWRWSSWGAVAGWMDEWRARLRALPAGSPVAFPPKATPQTLALDLAIQEAGLVAAPFEPTVPAGEIGPEPVFRVAGDRIMPFAGGEGGEWPAADRGASAPRQAGGVRVAASPGSLPGQENELAGEQNGLVLSQERLLSLGQLVAEDLATADHTSPAGPEGNREVLATSLALSRFDERVLLAWAILSGAALVLEPEPPRRPATAAWARPTLFHGTPAEIEELAGHAARGARGRAATFWRRRPRLPFGRLHTLYVLGPGALSEAQTVFWEVRGARVAVVPHSTLPRDLLRLAH